MDHGTPSTDTANWRSKSKAMDAAPPLAVEDLRRRTLDPPTMPQAGGDRCRDGVGWAEFVSLALLQPNENERVHHLQCLQNG
jgi:hypothetical protein